MSGPRMRRRGFVLAAAIVALTGCAVMEINIDVYKGPLADHQEVQVKQFAAMVVAARPMLVGLRDNIENRARLAKRKDTLDKRPCHTVRPLVCDSGLESPEAQRINALISLYEDETDEPRLRPLIERIRSALQEYSAAESILGPASEEARRERERLLGRIAAGFRRDEMAWKVDCGQTAKVNTIESARECLIRAYSQLIYPGDGEYASSQLARASWRLTTVLQQNDLQLFEGEPTKGDLSANAIFDRLRNRQLVRAHAEQIFRNQRGSEVEEFVSLVNSIGEAFNRSREALRDALRAALDLAVTVNDSALAEYRRGRPLIMLSVSQLISTLIQPEHVAAAMCLTDGQSIIPAARELENLLPQFRSTPLGRDLLMQTSWPNVGPGAYFVASKPADEQAKSSYHSSLREAQGAIEAVLQKDPVRLAYALRQVDWELENGTYKIDCSKLGGKADLQENFTEGGKTRLTYGLARGPTPSARTVKDTFARTMQSFETLRQYIGGGGLEDGRPQTGLIKTLENYMREIEKSPYPDHDRNSKQRMELERLIDALVMFAEKILFIANNNYVLDPALFDAAATTQFRQEINPYVFGLQSIGNHIMITADELRHRHSHRDKLEARAEVERAALQRALAPPPGKLIDETAAAMRADAGRFGDQAAAQRTLQKEAEAVAGATPAAAVDRAAAVESAGKEVTRTEKALNEKKDAVVMIYEAHKLLVSSDAFRIKLDVRLRASDDKAKVCEADVATAAAALIDDEVKAISAGVDAADAKKSLAAAKLYFEDQKTRAPKTPMLDVVKQILAVQDRLKDAKSAADNEVAKIASDVESAKAKKVALERAIAAAEKAAKLEGDRKGLEDGAAAFAGAKSDILKEIQKANAAGSPSAAWKVAQDFAESRKAKYAVWKPAADYMAKNTPPLVYDSADAGTIVGTPSANGPKENAQEVIDRIIVTLRHEYIMAVRQYGENAGTAPMIRDALARAFEQRSGLAYLRPSSAYLRSSYAATLLQDDPGLHWRNLLNGPVRRSIPLIGGDLENHQGEQRLRILTDIDKQYWQSINRVRLSGGGATNYAIVKDDLGNWYVKGYSSDTSKITQSAANLALFNIGGKLGTDLINRARRADAGSANGNAQAAADVSKADRSAVGRALDRFKAQYEKKTETDAKSAATQLSGDGGVGSRIKASFAKNNDTKGIPEFPGEVDTARTDYLDATGAAVGKATAAESRAAGVVDATRALWKFRGALVERLGSVELTETDEAKRKAARGTAQRIVMEAVDEAIDALIAARETAVRDFEGQILVLGEATKPD